MKQPVWEQNENGVSEIIGAILLIAMTVLAASVVGVYIFSQPQAEPVDRAEILISANATTVIFQNMGGDALGEADLALYYSGANVNFDSSSVWPFEPGYTITYTPASPPPTTNLSDSVYLIFTGTSSEGVLLDVLVEEGQVDRTSWAVTAPGPIPTASGGGQPPTPAEAGEIVWESVKENSVYYMELSDDCDIITPSSFVFSTTGTDNWIQFENTTGSNKGPHKHYLTDGDLVSITTTGQTDEIWFYGVGSTGIAFGFDRSILTAEGNPIGTSPVIIRSALIDDYTVVSSTLSFLGGTVASDDDVTFIYNDTEFTNNTKYAFSNIYPTESGLILLDFRKQSADNPHFFLLARADVTEI